MNSQITKVLRIVVFSGLFLIPFIPFIVSSSFFFPFIAPKAFAFRIIVEIIFAAWLLLAFVDANYRLRKSPILYAVGAFLVVIGLADIFGVAPVKSFWSNFERMEGYVTLLHLGALFVAMASVFKNEHWKAWWNTSLVASFIMGLYALAQVLGSIAPSQAGTRVDGTFGNTIYLAVYMLFHIFIALFFLWKTRVNVGLRYVYGLLIAFQLFILYHTATRGAILGLLGGLLITAFLNLFNKNENERHLKKSSMAVLAGLLLLVGGFLAFRNADFVTSNPVLARFSSLTTEEIKTQGRYFVWPIAYQGFKDRPILGWGQENFNYVFNEYYTPDMYHLEPWFDRAHNIFLDWMVAGGILGLLSYLGLYLALIYLIWRKDGELTHADKSVLTGLVAAYFFHNFFVFDHLISYVLFFSLLAYVHSRNAYQAEVQERPVSGEVSSPEYSYSLTLPVVGVALLVIIYFVNVEPIRTNTSLLTALASLQNQSEASTLNAAEHFEKAHSISRLGRPEVVEHISLRSNIILSNETASIDKRNEYFLFAKDAVLKQVEIFEDDARHHLLAGSFFSTTGQFEDAVRHLNRAKELMPNKQQAYFELGYAYINNGLVTEALESFREAYELAPDYREAQIIYLIGAIYAGDIELENKLLSELPQNAILVDDRVFSAYSGIANFHLDRGRPDEAIRVLRRVGELVPEQREAIDEYIRQIQAGN